MHIKKSLRITREAFLYYSFGGSGASGFVNTLSSNAFSSFSTSVTVRFKISSIGSSPSEEAVPSSSGGVACDFSDFALSTTLADCYCTF